MCKNHSSAWNFTTNSTARSWETMKLFNLTESLINQTLSDRNQTNDSLATLAQEVDDRKLITWDDATWILTCTFTILTMQSGFGLLESGNMNRLNQVNIMYKNVIDVIFGGITYWMVGFGLAHGEDYSNGFTGWGYFFVSTTDESKMGWLYTWFFFDMAFATTATTIVSGALAGRTKLAAYIIFSAINTFTYVFPAHWVWGTNGFLKELGVIDIAGCGPVHLVGGATSLVATLILGPRLDEGQDKDDKNMVNCILGLFMLWWGWLGFNCGSTYGISRGKWKYAARAAAVTICGSIGAGFSGVFLSLLHRRYYNVEDLLNCILGGLVSITAICAVTDPWESIIIGMLSSPLSLGTDMVGSLWGMTAVGIFAKRTYSEHVDLTGGREGLVHGGGFDLCWRQLLAAVSILAWTILVSYVILKTLDLTMGLRMSRADELEGADWNEHRIRHGQYEAKTCAYSSVPVAALQRRSTGDAIGALKRVGNSRGADVCSTGATTVTSVEAMEERCADTGNNSHHI